MAAQIKAKYNSVCAETGNSIPAGDECIYFPRSRKVFSLESERATEWLEKQANKEPRKRNMTTRLVTARFLSGCDETNDVIPVGTTALYYPRSKKMYSLESRKAKNWLKKHKNALSEFEAENS